MRIDRSHRSWMIASISIVAVGLLLYIVLALNSPQGPRGGSILGLIFGSLGYALMLFAGLLGVRKKFPVCRVGRAQTWMRGHLWLGLVSFPLILLHGGFAWRGPLTAVLMFLFLFVIISGIAGAAFQHYLPRLMTLRVPMETIYEEIPHVRVQLRDEADKLVVTICGPLDARASFFPKRLEDRQAEDHAVTTLIEVEQEEKARFRDTYVNSIRPFLATPDTPGGQLADSSRAGELFESLRRLLPAQLHPALADLENICEEERQLNLQMRMYRWLHGWLLVHVPLSIVLLVLGGVHAIVALRY